MFFKKKEKKVLHKPLLCGVDGKVIPMEEVNDPVFSEKMMGDGYALISHGDDIHACMDATITMVFPSNHAIGLTSDDGMEILIHIGIDTVKEEGKGFEVHTSKDSIVKAGDKLISFDREYLSSKGYDLSVMMIFTNKQAYESFEVTYGSEKKACEEVGFYQ